MRRRSFIVATAMVAGLMLGVVLGPNLRSTITSAQSAQPTGQPADPARGGQLWSSFMDQLAAALNIQRSALDTAVTTAGTNTLDAAVKDGTLTQGQADAMAQRLAAGDVGPLLGGRGGPRGGPRMDGGVRQAAVEAAASALNLTAEELHTKLHDGATLAELASAAGTTEQAVTDAALAAAKTKLDAAVTAGTLTQEQADAIYARLQEQGANLLSMRGHGPGGRGGPPPADAPAQPTATTTT